MSRVVLCSLSTCRIYDFHSKSIFCLAATKHKLRAIARESRDGPEDTKVTGACKRHHRRRDPEQVAQPHSCKIT